jgi:hypothetical protein
MTPTRGRELVAVAALGVLGGVLLFALAYSDLPSLSLTAPIGLAVLAVLEGWTASLTRARLARRPGTTPLSPFAAARLAVLAKASSPVGALLAGAWAGALVWLLVRVSQAATGRHDAQVCAIGLAGSLLLVGAALWLEHVCRLPPDAENDAKVDAASRTGARTR